MTETAVDVQGATEPAQSVQVMQPAQDVQGVNEPAAVQIVRVEEDHSYYLNQQGLEKILLREDIKDLPVAVVSVAGSYRGGKSFILNFFLRYLNAAPSARSDGSWLGSPEDVLTGFSWRGGSERNTTGILMWSEPFLITLPGGDKVAVLVMDTQGTFESESTVRDSCTIFAMSTLLSSRQIFNIKGNLNENDLQNLQLFTSYGKLMKEQTGNPFQMLEFLLRDWANDEEYAYGQAGGDLYLANKFQVVPGQPPELTQMHQNIRDSFEKVTCFLMPHPGLRVSRPTFKGQTKDITEEFCTLLKELVPSIFSPESLSVKHVGVHRVTSCDLFTLFQSYLKIFNSDEIPQPQTIIEVTSDAALLKAIKEVREQFSKRMEAACGVNAPSMPAVDVIDNLQQSVTAARAAFKDRLLFGDPKEIDKECETLMKELNDQEKDFIMINMLKTMRAIENGIKAYDQFIKNVSKGEPLCVHAYSVHVIHDNAVAAAISAFSNNRKAAPGRQDTDKEKFEKYLFKKYQSLEQNNDQTNKTMITELKNEYFNTMLNTVNGSENVCPAPFTERHEVLREKALMAFEARRQLVSSYAEDGYRTSMQQSIDNQYQMLKQINESKQKELLTKVISEFEKYSTSARKLRSECMLPGELVDEHNFAKRNAIQSILPKQLCSKDNRLIQQIFLDRYDSLKEVNNSANNSVLSSAYWAFKHKYDYLRGYIIHIFLPPRTLRGYYLTALKAGKDVFYSRRRNRWSISYNSDIYYRQYVDWARDYYRRKSFFGF